jgi:hypothetical protein
MRVINVYPIDTCIKRFFIEVCAPTGLFQVSGPLGRKRGEVSYPAKWVLFMALINSNIRQRLVDGQFVAEREAREHPCGVFKFAIRLESAVFTNRLDALLQLIDALNTPSVNWASVTGPFGVGKTSLSRALAECVPVENIIWLETPVDVEQFAAHLAKAFHQPDVNLFEAIRHVNQHTLVVLNRAHLLLTTQGRWQLPDQHRPIVQALLQNGHCRVVWSGEQEPPADVPIPVKIPLGALAKLDVKALLQRVLAPYPEGMHNRLLQLTQGHPWRVRLLWRVLKSSQPVTLLNTLLATSGQLEERLLATHAAHWSPDVQTLLCLLAASDYPLSLAQLQHGLKAAYPGSLLDLATQIEQSELTPFIQRVTPVQLAHNRQALAGLALYQLVPQATAWLKQQPLPWAQGQRGLKAIWQLGLEHPSTATHIGIRRLRKALQDCDVHGAASLHKTDTGGTLVMGDTLPQLQKQLQVAISQGLVSQQLELLEAMAMTFQHQHQWQDATRVLQHTLSLAQITENPQWALRAKERLHQLIAQEQ